MVKIAPVKISEKSIEIKRPLMSKNLILRKKSNFRALVGLYGESKGHIVGKALPNVTNLSFLILKIVFVYKKNKITVLWMAHASPTKANKR